MSSSHLKPFNKLIFQILGPCLKGHPMTLVRLITYWQHIIPKPWHSFTLPYKVWLPQKGYGILYLDVWRVPLIEVQSHHGIFTHHINRFLGFSGIQTLKLRQQQSPPSLAPSLSKPPQRPPLPKGLAPLLQKRSPSPLDARLQGLIEAAFLCQSPEDG